MAEPSPTIEQDIADLEHKLQEKKAALEHEKSEKDILHGIVGEKIQEQVPQYLPTAKAPTPVTAEPSDNITQEIKDKVAEIVKIVFDKNLDEGIKEASKDGNMAVIDEFHDVLTNELYDQLIAQRKLPKVD